MKLRGSKSRRQIKELLDDYSQLPPQVAIACKVLSHLWDLCLPVRRLSKAQAMCTFVNHSSHHVSIPRQPQARVAQGTRCCRAGSAGRDRHRLSPGQGCTRREGVQWEQGCALGRSPLGEGDGHTAGVWGSTSYPGGTERLHSLKNPVELSPESQSCLKQSQSATLSSRTCMLDPLLSRFSQTKPNIFV